MIADKDQNFQADEAMEQKVKAEIKYQNLMEDIDMMLRKCVDPGQNAALQGLQLDSVTWFKNNQPSADTQKINDKYNQLRS